ncbi:acyl-CoA Delta(11) desaturase-like isoform X1 [Diabrotica virgifera virgifera]|uniref:Fatty acid desaturase domain-containing protein n=3 Tax=Diabrotica virgifera virgifera TaxID=50390 RepID=A0ABM5KF26_DIAVI|nr:acyl-CoA Delta(11) desaturase-like isoform X1 [Diabrotica virgifera virgifera]
MPPLRDDPVLHQRERPTNNVSAQLPEKQKKRNNGYFEQDLVIPNIIVYIIMHSITIYGICRLFCADFKLSGILFSTVYGMMGSLGVTAGAHRLWAHRTYKAKLPLRIVLMLLQTLALQNDLYIWVRDHRLHHKYTDTTADPHNSNRGFFFSHVGWLLMRKHPDVIKKGKTIDVSDVADDPVVKFQRKYYVPLGLTLTFILPSIAIVYLFNETAVNAVLLSIGKYVLTLNGTWCVNSFAHIYGWKPFDSSINPVENVTVSIIGLGEGWHNYHHTFPWDYKAAELGNYRANLTTGFLDLMAYLGQAYDLKTVSPEMIRKRAARTGDGSYNFDKVPLENDNSKDHHNFQEDCVWGWDDKDMKEELRKATIKY